MVTYRKVLRIAVYARVSHDEQKKYGFSIQAQIDKILKYAEANGYQIVDIFKDEGFTATKMKRPALLEMLDRVNEFDIIVFTRLDRFTRNVLQANKMVELLDTHGVAIKSIEEEDIDTSTANGRFNFNLRVSLAQREAELTSERLKSIFDFKRQQGQPVTGNQPYGYKIDRKDGKKTIVIDEEKKPIVEEIYRHFAKYHSIRGALVHVCHIYDLKMDYKVVHKIITSPVYYGEYGGNPNYYPPYLTKEEYDRNQEKVKDYIWDRNNDNVYLFTSLIRCPHCGRKKVIKYSKRTFKNGNTKEYTYYICVSRQKNGWQACPESRNINEKVILEYLMNNIEELAKNHILNIKEVIPQEKTDLPQNRINEILEEMDRLSYAYRKKRISVKDYDRDYEALERELATIKKEVPSEDDVTILEEFLSSDWKAIYNSLDRVNQRALWRNLIKEIKLDKDYNISIEFL